jgi:Flp pilus assembly pilin Flp
MKQLMPVAAQMTNRSIEMHRSTRKPSSISQFIGNAAGTTLMEYALLAALASVVALIALLAVLGPKT